MSTSHLRVDERVEHRRATSHSKLAIPLHRTFRVALSSSEALQELARHPRVVVERPPDFGKRSGRFRRFLLIDDHEHGCWLLPESKLSATPSDQRDVGSDRNRIVVSLEATPEPSGAKLVASIRAHPTPKIRRRRLILAAILGPTAILGGALGLLLGAPSGFGIWGIACLIGLFVGLFRGNRPNRSTLAEHGPGIWQVLGEVFVRHEVGAARGTAPYRLSDPAVVRDPVSGPGEG